LAELLQNNSASTLTVAIPDGVATTLTVANGAAFPATGNFRIIIDSEFMLCTSRASNVLTVTRGIETTTAVAHSNGAAVTHVVTKGGLDQYLTEFALSSIAVHRSTVLSIPSNVITAVTGVNTTDWTQGGGITLASDKLVVSAAGIYLAVANIQWASAPSATELRFDQSVATVTPASFVCDDVLTALTQVAVSAVLKMTASASIGVSVYQNSGAAVNVTLLNWSLTKLSG
jgi:hypothetical protein